MSSDNLSSSQSARRSDSYFLYKVGRYESALVLKLSMQKETSVKHTGSAAAKWSLQNPSFPQLLALSVGLHSMKQLRELLLTPPPPPPASPSHDYHSSMSPGPFLTGMRAIWSPEYSGPLAAVRCLEILCGLSNSGTPGFLQANSRWPKSLRTLGARLGREIKCEGSFICKDRREN